MKQSTLLLLSIILLMTREVVFAQDKKGVYPGRHKYSVAILAGEQGYDVGVGAEIGSPSFLNQRFCVRLKTNVNWTDRLNINADHASPYIAISSTLVYSFLSVERGRVYVEAGPLIILSANTLSKDNLIDGLIASTGIELFVANSSTLNLCYYFSAGIRYSRAAAEKLDDLPRYGNGFDFSNGFRLYF